MNGRSASQPATPPVSCTSMTIAVQLSGPPQVLARSTRRCAASSGDPSVRPVLRSDSETVPHSPSEQRRYRSPAHSSSDTTSTSTLAAVPSALVRIFPFADVPRIGWIQQSLAYHVRRHGMVLRQLSQYIAPKAVAPAVTDVADICPLCMGHQRYQRRPHARQFLRRKRQAVDDRVRFMNGEPQALFRVFGRQLPRGPCRDKGLHGRTRSDFSCLCSAETIANDITGPLTLDLLAFLNDGKAVLIGVTLQSDVSPTRSNDPHGDLLTEYIQPCR